MGVGELPLRSRHHLQGRRQTVARGLRSPLYRRWFRLGSEYNFFMVYAREEVLLVNWLRCVVERRFTDLMRAR